MEIKEQCDHDDNRIQDKNIIKDNKTKMSFTGSPEI